MELHFSAALWAYGGEGSWFFVSMPEDLSEELRELTAARGPRRGFGSVRVRATIGGTTFSTSVFPSKEGPYLLPVKRAVREAEGLDDGDDVEVRLVVLA